VVSDVPPLCGSRWNLGARFRPVGSVINRRCGGDFAQMRKLTAEWLRL
jgi:hypothetical protein